MMEAMECSGCDMIIVSAFGFGAFKHPPEEVATMFKEEIATAGVSKCGARREIVR